MEHNFGENGSQNNVFFASDQCTYRFGTSGSNFPDLNMNQYNFVRPHQTMLTSPQVFAEAPQAVSEAVWSQPDVQEIPRPVASKKVKEKNVSRRGLNFTTEEDAVICSAWLNVTTDAVIGCNQTQGGFYKRMHTYFKQNKPQGSDRSQIAIQGRWKLIQKAVNKFCGFKAIIDRRNESGKNEADRVEDAVKMFEEKEQFHFMHCWKILRNEPKWNNKLLEQSSGNAPTNENSQEQLPSDTNNVSERPEGRDSAKRRNKRAAESEASTAVEVLQRIHDNREKNQAKEDDQLQQILARKDEKLSLQREILQIKKQTREEDLQLRKQETELRAKQTEAQLMAAEAGIMGVDLAKVAPHLKDYYIGMQRQIMERRGFAPSSSNINE